MKQNTDEMTERQKRRRKEGGKKGKGRTKERNKKEIVLLCNLLSSTNGRKSQSQFHRQCIKKYLNNKLESLLTNCPSREIKKSVTIVLDFCEELCYSTLGPVLAYNRQDVAQNIRPNWKNSLQINMPFWTALRIIYSQK